MIDTLIAFKWVEVGVASKKLLSRNAKKEIKLWNSPVTILSVTHTEQYTSAPLPDHLLATFIIPLLCPQVLSAFVDLLSFMEVCVRGCEKEEVETGDWRVGRQVYL